MLSLATLQRLPRQLGVAFLSLSLLLPRAGAAEPLPPPSGTEREAGEPKFIWGILINLLANYAMSAFSAWLKEKLTDQQALPTKMDNIYANAVTAHIIPLVQILLSQKSVGAEENTTLAPPQKPLQVEGGRPNYQGMNLAVLGFDGQGQFKGLQVLEQTFATGERIKLKVLPTFDGLLVVENINPKGDRQQIYPPKEGSVVALKQGVEVLLPLGRDEYFQFAGLTGDERLVITLRDPRAVDGAASAAPANREDTANGSNFVQETPPGTFPVIAQSLTLRHGR